MKGRASIVRSIGVLCLALTCSQATYAQATDLIISEYVEGSSSNKYIEVYNGTGAAVNLAGYRLRLFANGAAAPTNDVLLSGVLANGAVIVYRNSGAVIYGGATTVNAAVNFNGNDAIAIYKISTASYVDIFGNIGCDPGSQWSSGANSTANQTLRRNANICAGITVDDPTICPFPTLASEWTALGSNNVSGLGSHTMTCSATVTFAIATNTVPESVGSVAVALNISPATTVAGSIIITIANGAGATYPGDYTTAPAGGGGTITIPVGVGATGASFTINVVDDIATEATETITFTITSTTGGIFIGGANTHTFNITDNDNTPTVNFVSTNRTVIENAGVQNFQLAIFPAIATAGTITITIGNGPGVTYTGDYTTAPAGGGGTISIPVIVGQTAASFNLTLNNDAVPENTETVQFTISGIPPGAAFGSSLVIVLTIGDDDNPQTILNKGDLAIVGLNANNFACTGISGEDEISFFSFKDITYGTTLDLTDNGYERCNAGLWGDTEGTIRATRTGPTILAGTSITFRSNGSGGYTALGPDAGWTFVSLNGATNYLAMNNGGDQIFFMQGGVWTNPGGAHDATYTGGRILYGFSTNPTFPWSADCGSTQRSNLPPQMQCFSMSPTAASDFAKYTGPATATNQRGWIIRIGNPLNWSTYGSCGAYNASSPDYLGGYTFPFTTTGFTPGLWVGATDFNWFECTNWDDARVPDLTIDVTVNGAAIRNCIVDGGGTAECATLTVTSGGINRSLTVDNSSTLNVYGATWVERTTAAGQAGVIIQNAGNFTTLGLTVGGNIAPALQGYFRSRDPANSVLIDGNVTINNYGNLDLTGVPGGTIDVTGNFVNNYASAAFLHAGSTVRMIGTGPQLISTPGFVEYFGKLRINKPSGDATINAPIIVTDELDLTQGRIMNIASEKVTLQNTCTVVNTSDASFVHGPVEKFGNTAFTFPVGKGSEFRPISITGLVGNNSWSMTSEYTYADPVIPFGNVRDPTLNHVSRCEYWILERSSGSLNAFVTLSWRPSSCGVTLLSDLRVARHDGAVWRDHGNGGTTGNTTAGTVITSGIVTLFSPFTLASITTENPLPIELLSFDARPNGTVVDLAWSTASERDNDYFTIERSEDGTVFQPMSIVGAVGNSTQLTEYTDVDGSPLPGRSFYRLRQTDIDGTSTTSNVVSVLRDGKNGNELVIFSDFEQMHAYHDMPVGSLFQIYSSDGRLIDQGPLVEENLLRLDASRIPKGAYVLRISFHAKERIGRFLR